MEGGIPLIGLNKRCALAAVDGLSGLDECRNLAGQVSRFILASGGELVDHAFLSRDQGYGLRIWACREDPIGFIASLRAALRCLVDTPERLQATPRFAAALPRVQVTVALAPVRNPVCPAILALLASGTDIEQLTRALCAAVFVQTPVAGTPSGDAVAALLALRPADVAPENHLRQLLHGLGVPESAAQSLLDAARLRFPG